jgi:transglutaminase-like putative cysteine protease
MANSQPLTDTRASGRFMNAFRWLNKQWQKVFLRGDFTALLLAFGALIVPALAMQAAGWTDGLGQLVPVAVLSVFFGFLLARSHYGELLSLLISGVYSVGFIGIITAISIDGGSLPERIYTLFVRSAAWINVLLGRGVSQDNLIFVLFLSILFWFLGHNTAWHIFRVDRVWRAILPPGLVIIVNVFYYTGDSPLELYMAIFMVFALLLIVRSTIDAQEWEWYLKHITFPPQLRTHFLRWGAVLAVVLVGVAWTLPNGAESESLEQVQEFLNSDPLEELNRLFNRLFASLDSEGLATADYYGGNSLQLGGAIQLGDQPVMLVDAPPIVSAGQRYYWRSRTFSHYEGGRWTPTADVRLTVPDPGYAIEGVNALPDMREPVQQRFTMVLNASRLVYTAPQPQIMNLPVSIDLSYTDEQQRQMDVSVIRPLQVLRTGDEYTVVSSISTADAPSLRAAGTAYPQWVLADYLQVGGSITQRTRDLAVQIVTQANAGTPYDQAKAVERWLRRNIVYDEAISGPPPGVDPVDWVLFEDQRGYCNYYASAMIAMLRSLGIPARMAAGFSQGEWDGATQSYLVRERDAHTWVEVYFPGFGWVEFEPTAAQAPLDRPDTIPPQGDLQTATPFLTNTPQPTPLPTLTPTPLPTSTPDPALGPEPIIPPTVTPLPTPSPTPAVMPTVVAPAIEQTQSRSLLTSILSALLYVLVVVIAVIALAVLVIFIIWWLEWRGLGGLTPVQRAYALLERYAGYLGIRLSDSYTPFERRRVISDHIPKGDKPVRVITDMYVEETYGQERKRRGRWNIAARNALSDARRAFFRARLSRFLPRRWRR